MEAGFARSQGLTEVVPAMFQPVRIGPLELKNRVIVSPMDMYSAADGLPDAFHLVHLGSKALGGAGLVMTEMVCVSPEGRITPGCTGLWTDAQRDAWAEVTEFVHARSTAKIGLQLGHSGRKGSTRLMWDGIDQPLEEGNWEVIGPSAVAYGDGCQLPREATRADLDQVVADFVAAARRGVAAGFDLIEVHAAHGYLLSSFLSPVANKRTDEYGGSLEARLRFPLEVFDAVRAAVPATMPVTVRISATDWVPDGNTEIDAVAIARAFIEHGAAAIDVSSGQVTAAEKPAFGRSYQTPFADLIRHQVAEPAGVKVIAVGAISSYDDVNSILLAGRADLCALGRAHLYNPQWTLQAAAEQDYRGPGADWPEQFGAGRRRPPSSRTDKVPPRLTLLREARRRRRARPLATGARRRRVVRSAAPPERGRAPGAGPESGRIGPVTPNRHRPRASGPPQSRTVLVSFLGAIVRRMGDWMPIAGTIELMGQFGLDAPSVRTAVFRLKQRGWLASETRAGSRGYALTPVALKALAAGDEIIWHARHPADLADGWCIVSFSVPESARGKRDQLRTHLASLGFGNVGAAMWIAPARMRAAADQAIAELGLTSYCAIFVGDYVGGRDLPGLLRDSWDLAEIDRRYLEYARRFADQARQLGSGGDIDPRRRVPQLPGGRSTSGASSPSAIPACPASSCRGLERPRRRRALRRPGRRPRGPRPRPRRRPLAPDPQTDKPRRPLLNQTPPLRAQSAKATDCGPASAHCPHRHH